MKKTLLIASIAAICSMYTQASPSTRFFNKASSVEELVLEMYDRDNGQLESIEDLNFDGYVLANIRYDKSSGDLSFTNIWATDITSSETMTFDNLDEFDITVLEAFKVEGEIYGWELDCKYQNSDGEYISCEMKISSGGKVVTLWFDHGDFMSGVISFEDRYIDKYLTD